jgi:hypothetical protein
VIFPSVRSHCPLLNVHSIVRIFKYDDKVIEDTRNNRADAMKKDLNNLLKSIEGSFKKVWGKDGNLKVRKRIYSLFDWI